MQGGILIPTRGNRFSLENTRRQNTSGCVSRRLVAEGTRLVRRTRNRSKLTTVSPSAEREAERFSAGNNTSVELCA